MTGTALALILRCRRLGIDLAADGNRLRYRPLKAVSAGLRAQLVAHKRDVLSALALQAAPNCTEPRCEAHFAHLRIDNLGRRVLDALDRGKAIPLASADFQLGGALCGRTSVAVYNNT